MSQILTVAIELIFAALFALAVARYRRDRSVVSRDLVLIFGSFAWLLVQEIVKDVGGALPTPITQVATLYLLAQPIFALHLAGQFVTLKRFALPAAIVGFVATSGPLIVLGTGAPKCWARRRRGVHGHRSHRRDHHRPERPRPKRPGRRPAPDRRVVDGDHGIRAARRRRRVIQRGAGGATLIAPSLVLVSGLGYLVALLPPKRLQRIWHASAAFPELRDFLLLADDTQIWDSLVSGARRMTGAPIALVAEPGDDGWRVLAASGIDPTETSQILERFPADGSERATNWAEGGTSGAFAYGLIVTLAGPSEVAGSAGNPRLVVVSARPSLFPDDDRLLLEALGGQALTLAQRASLFCLAGFDGRFHRVNEAWSRTLGWSVEDLTSTPFMDFVHPDDRETTLAAFGDLLEAAGPREPQGQDGGWLRFCASSMSPAEPVTSLAAQTRMADGKRRRSRRRPPRRPPQQNALLGEKKPQVPPPPSASPT